MYDVDILNYTSVWWNGRKKVEEMMRRVFSPSLPTPTPSMFFPAHFSLHLLQYLNMFNRLFSGARRLVWFKGTELRSLYCFPYLKFNWSNNFESNNRCKKLEQLLVVLGPRAHSWHPVVTVGLLSARLFLNYYYWTAWVNFLFIACFDGRHHLNAHLVDLHLLLEPKISRQTFK